MLELKEKETERFNLGDCDGGQYKRYYIKTRSNWYLFALPVDNRADILLDVSPCCFCNIFLIPYLIIAKQMLSSLLIFCQGVSDSAFD